MSGQNSITEIIPAGAAAITQAATLINAGRCVAVPTETVYGLAARADSEEAVAGIYQAKGRPSFNPLIVHVADTEQAQIIGRFDPMAMKLAEAFWPGPLTIVVPLQPNATVAMAVTAGLPTVALRCPAHPVMQALLREAALPLAAPSANRSGAVSPTSAAHVAASLEGRIEFILDGGTCTGGIESTIVAVRPGLGWSILRHGPILPAAIAKAVGVAELSVEGTNTIEAPGQLASHYSPGKPVRLAADIAEIDEFHIGFGSCVGHINLSPVADMAEAAANLYAALHMAKSAPQLRVAVAPIPETGIGVAINDRLRRAAA